MVLMRVVERKDDPIDMNQLLEHFPGTSKQSMQSMVRKMVNKAVIEKGMVFRRGQNRVMFVPTDLGLQIMGKGIGKATISAPLPGSLEEEIEELLGL